MKLRVIQMHVLFANYYKDFYKNDIPQLFLFFLKNGSITTVCAIISVANVLQRCIYISELQSTKVYVKLQEMLYVLKLI